MQSLAVKYRPKEFSEICSQQAIIKILENQIQTNSIKNCYLFSGKSGCGKTTAARCFADKINNGQGHPIELNAASTNGIDAVRELEIIATTRAIDSIYKVIILDECHSLTNQAWQALLKLIEEPPEYTIFIFCSTDPQKIPNTILNRVMRLNFTRIDSKVISLRLKYICEQEGFINYTDTCDYISRICKGGMRDGIALLEKCATYSTNLNLTNCRVALGTSSHEFYFKLINTIIDGNEAQVIKLLDTSDISDYKVFINEFINFCLDISKYILFKSIEVTKFSVDEQSELNKAISIENPSSYYNYYIDKLFELKQALKDDTEAQSTIEICLLKMTRLG